MMGRVMAAPTLEQTEQVSDLALGCALAAAAGFVLIISATAATNTAGALALTAVTVAGGAALGHFCGRGRVGVVIGGVVAVVCVWLAPQRDDAGTAVLLGLLFGIGLGLGMRGRATLRAAAVAAIGVVVLLVVRLAASQAAVGWLTAAAVAGAVALALVAPSAQGRRFGSVFVGVVLATTLLFTGYVGAETPGATWFGGGAVHGPATGNQVALTFDDGPNIGTTLKVMNILDDAGVKGTFFEVGKAIDAEPQITRALYADGQLLGNHSYHHDQWRWLDPQYPELERTQQAFQRAIGTCPVLYRPPHGDRTPFIARIVEDHGMHMVLWSASAGDWATDDATLVARRIVERAKPGAILLLHDGLDGKPTANRDVLVRALPLILSGLRAKGLQPVRLDQLLGTPAYTSCR
jgi:peptidoglycan/xylan/chitin deacetylase (PgdA/CDA1 family)